jgi:hypothetical protein
MKKKAVLSALMLTLGVSVQAQDTTYDWTGGAPGFSGSIILDSPLSSGGSLSDILSISITTPSSGTISMNMSPGRVFLTDPTFTWNHNQITEMFIGGSATKPFDNIYVTENSGGGNDESAFSILYDNEISIDTSGSWVAPSGVGVPDTGGGIWLLGFALAGLGGCRRFLR